MKRSRGDDGDNAAQMERSKRISTIKEKEKRSYVTASPRVKNEVPYGSKSNYGYGYGSGGGRKIATTGRNFSVYDVPKTSSSSTRGYSGGRGKINRGGRNGGAGNVNEDRETTRFSYSNDSGGKKNSNPNVRRCLDSVVKCNGMVVNNNFKHCVTSYNVKRVTSYFSAVVPINGVPGGPVESAIVRGLIDNIERYGTGKTVVGYVAWLSNPKILAALETCRRVLLIVNKEDYTTWGSGKCLTHYKKLPEFDEPLSVAFLHLDTLLKTLETDRRSGKSRYASVRAWGGQDSLEHNKILVFFEKRYVTARMATNPDDPNFANLDPSDFLKALGTRLGKRELDETDGAWFEFPFAYWTGSMNFTTKSERHHESAEFVEDDNLARAKLHDFATTFMDSVPVASKSSSATPFNNKRIFRYDDV